METVKFRIALTNLGKYNEGDLVIEWLDLPFDDYELEDAKDAIGIGMRYEEWFVSDYESNIDVGISEGVDIHQLNEDIKLLIDRNTDAKAIRAISDGFYHDFNEVINIVESERFYTVEAKNYTDLGYYLLTELDGIELPNNVADYFDFNEYGKDSEYHLYGDVAVKVI